MNYLPVGNRAVDEYDTLIYIFGIEFPWLFPSSRGGPFDVKTKNHQWLEDCIYYEDGRFAVNKVFAFYAKLSK